MTCLECQQRIGETRGAEPLPARVAAHVEACESCALALVAERHVRSTLAAAPWPASALTHDIARLRAIAEAADARAARRRSRWLLGGLGVGGVLAVMGWVALRASPGWEGVGRADAWLWGGLLIAGAALWVGLDVAGRRLAAQDASSTTLVGLGAARAVLTGALIVVLIHPAPRPTFGELAPPSTWRPAAAGGTSFEATLICVNRADGRHRAVPWHEGCRDDEFAVPAGAVDGPVASTPAAASDYRAGRAVIPAGENGVFVPFAHPMPYAEFSVALAPTGTGFDIPPFAADASCRFPVVGGKSRDGFWVSVRRCWFEGDTVPLDRVKSDLALDWIVFAVR